MTVKTTKAAVAKKPGKATEKNTASAGKAAKASASKAKPATPAKVVKAPAQTAAKKPVEKASAVAPAARAVAAQKAKSPVRSVAVPVPPAPARSETPAAAAAPAARTPQRAPIAAAQSPAGATQRTGTAPARTGPKPMTPKDVATRFAQQRQAAAQTAQRLAAPSASSTSSSSQPAGAPATDPKKPISQRHGFKINEHIVYPAHGVGRIVGIEEQEIAGMSLELFVITFDKDKMTLRVPTAKLQAGGMRKLSDEALVKRAIETLKGRARIKRTMWSRRAQEYEAKINSGDLIAVAEVVRDLYRSEAQPEQSYSERQLYELALDRMAREIGAVEKLDDRGAVQRITDELARSARGRRLAAEEAAAAEDSGDDADASEGEGEGDVQAA